MVKFSKELEAQLIPEWKDAFVNYWHLKKQIKKVKLACQPKLSPPSRTYDVSFFLSFVSHPFRSLATNFSYNSSPTDHELQVKKNEHMGGNKEDDDEDDSEEVVSDTELSQLFSEEDEVKKFFDMLNDELGKVNKFYGTKERELLEKGEALNKQLQILMDLKQILHARRRKNLPSSFHGGLLSRSTSNSSSARYYSDSSAECVSVAIEDKHGSTQTDEVIAALERNGLNLIGLAPYSKSNKGKPKTSGLRIDIPATNPAQTISAVTTMMWEDLVNTPNKESPREVINKKKIQCAEKMIRGAFVELYKGLGFLKTYRSLNMVAFTKILKKFDKVANRQSSASYLKMVRSSHFVSSDKVVRLMDEVESLFIKHFADSDRKKAMKFLRPHQQKDSHMVTFFVGLFTGCFATLFVVYAILAHISGMFSPGSNDESGYMETVYPIFSTFALLSLHLFMYGCNLLTWKVTRINYSFIFEFSPKTALKYRDAFLICTSLMTAVVSALVIHLILRSSGFTPQQIDIIPGILLLTFFALLICPFNVFYRSTRYSFIKVIRNIVFSPFYKVLMVDFFMADQLTSQIPMLRHMETTACYFLAHSFKPHHYDVCKKGKLYREIAYVISFAPYYWRAMQCARRWFDESDPKQLANLGKYVSAMIAAGMRLNYAQQQEPTLLSTVLVVATSAIATLYQLYWDFVQDWGFFNPMSKNPWLRDDLILKNKCIYYLSIVLNLVLRVVWVESVMRFIKVSNFEAKFLDFSLASLEVIRRGHWNFYRVENEHLNNVGNFRAVKSVPLPFHETDSDN